MDINIIYLIAGIIIGLVLGLVMMYFLMYQRIVSLRSDIRKTESLEERFKDAFKVLATDILNEREKSLKETNRENINEILKPLEINIKDFKEKVEVTHKDSIERSSKIVEKISLLERMNLDMTKEADKLSRALKGDSKFQGDWGEVVLETLLEKSGLIKDEEYFKQGKGIDTRNEEGINMKPDYIVKLPEDKYIIIDSKVSISSYMDYINANDEAEKNEALIALTSSIKSHINGLAGKKYQDLGINSPRFVLMFMPIEAAYTSALMYDKSIFDYATNKNIIVVTPTTLLPSLWLVNYVWKSEKQTKNAMEMVKQTGLLYDKLVTFVDTFSQIGNGIDKSKEIYDKAFNQLKFGKGNVISRAENIKKLGITNTKDFSKDLIYTDDNKFEDDININEESNE